MNNTIADAKQRLEAIDCHKSFIVQAPAGSGKTELLIQRFLALLSKVNTPQEILAITFTKKAANEMRERILSSLESARFHEPEEPHKQLTWKLAKAVLKQDEEKGWCLLDNPNQLKIQTIDSFCSYLTRQLPVLSYFGSQPEISDNPKKMYRETVQEVLSHVNEDVDWSDSIANILLYLDNDMHKLEGLLVNLIEKRDQWISHINQNLAKDEVKVILEENISAIIEEYLNSLIKLLPRPHIDELVEITSYCLNNLGKDYIEKKALLSGKTKSLQTWKFIAELLLTNQGEWRKRVDKNIGFISSATLKNSEEKKIHQQFKDRHKVLIEDLMQFEDFSKALNATRRLPQHSLSDNHADILVDLILVLRVLCAQLRLTFKKYGGIDFCENSLAALSALGSNEQPTDLALSLDYKIMHILIDEFQDTSSSQYILVEKLITGWQSNDGRTLFIVGDPMQSIYRFREAEVGLFLRMRENGIGDIKLKSLSLSVNFRSSHEIVHCNNQFYSKIFPENTHIPSGAVNFSQSIPSTTVDKANQKNINFFGFIDDGINQANYIAGTVKDLTTRHPQDSVAILVRSRSHLNYIIQALKNQHISYRAVDIDPLQQQPYIQDLFALSRALLHLYDRIAWLAILRAPWCGLTLNDLYVIGQDSNTSIWQAINNKIIYSKLSNDGKKQLERILPVLKQAIDNHSRYSLRYRIQHCWQLLGGPACLDHESELNDVDMFFRLLDKQTENNLDLSLEQLEESLKKLYALPDENHSQVQLMTIHSSKGLEFDTVILPHLERKPRHDDKSLLTWMDYPLSNNQIATLLAPLSNDQESNTVYEFIHQQNKQKADNEAKRLLYVATTRSKKRLFLTFSVVDKEAQAAGSFMSMLKPFISDADYFNGSEKITNPLDQGTNNSLMKLSNKWTNPYTLLSDNSLKKHQSYQGFYILSQHDHIAGSVVHLMLQKLSADGVTWWQELSNEDKYHYIQNLLLTSHLPFEALKQQCKFVCHCVDTALNDNRGLWLLDQNNEAYNEYELSLKNEDDIENIIIDKTFICDSNIRWIIDYKTSAPKNENLNAFLAEEKEKYAGKMALYAKAMANLDSRPIKCGLYFPAIAGWIEWGA